MPTAGPVRLALAVLAACTLALAGCTSTGSTGQPAAATTSAADHSPQTTTEADWAPVADALGRKGTADGGIYKFTVARKDTVVADQHVLPAGLSLTTAVNFQPLGGTQAAINGDLVMTAREIEPVILALRRGGIAIVELHNHSLDEQPRLFYLHFGATGDATALVQGLRPALDATNLAS